ncbi:MAG: AAA family ATPase [Candidatus Latescibacteria bacterium]|nr:AAA family ATPase [Candidatus Latescibacterota bacterium]
MSKKIVIVGGANGVGKTTFAHQYSDEFKIDYLGADEIAAGVDKINDRENIELKAGKIFFRRLEEYMKSGKSIIIESTLSGTGLSRQIEKFKKNGFSIRLVYVFLDDCSLCKKRVSARVKKGGHDIPEKDIERRFHRSILNFRKIYLPLADTWQIIYNGLKRPLEIAVGDKSSELIMDEGYYRKLMDLPN